jgi:hypothetical protein
VTVAEDLLEFENTVEDKSGLSHIAIVQGEKREDGRWLGRIRFVPTDGSPALETDRETTQPDRDDLAYWASGLTYSYLEGALERARRWSAPRTSEQPAGGGVVHPPLPLHAPRIEVASLDPAIAEEVLEVRSPRPGTGRAVPGAGFIVYEGIGGADGASHMFSVQFGSKNAGAVLTNWLWSRLHGKGALVRVNGRVVELTNEALKRAVVG